MTSFLSRKGTAGPAQWRMKAHVELEKKVGLAKTSQAGLTVAEQLNNFTEQPDKSPHIITGL